MAEPIEKFIPPPKLEAEGRYAWEASPTISTKKWEELERRRKSSGMDKVDFYKQVYQTFYRNDIPWEQFWGEATLSGVWENLKNLDGTPIIPRHPDLDPQTGLGKVGEWLLENRVIQPPAGHTFKAGHKEPEIMTGLPGMGLVGPSGMSPGMAALMRGTGKASEVAGKTISGVVRNVAAPHQSVARTIRHLLGPTGTPEHTAARILQGAAAGGPTKVPPPPVYGMRTTLGQRMNNEGVMSLGKGIEVRPEFKNPFAAAREDTRTAIERAADRILARTGSSEEAAEAVGASLSGAQKTLVDIGKKRWRKFDNQGGEVNSKIILDRAEAHTKGLPVSHRKYIPSTAVQDIRRIMKEGRGIEDLQALISDIKATARASNNSVERRVLNNFAHALDDELEVAAQGAVKILQSARRATRVERTIFEGTRKGRKKVTSPLKKPLEKSSDVEAGRALVVPGKDANIRASYIKRASRYNKDLEKDAQKYIIASYLERVMDRGAQGLGSSPTKSRAFLKDHKAYIDTNLSGPQRRLLKRINDAIHEAHRRPYVAGSDTKSIGGATDYLMEGITGFITQQTSRVPVVNNIINFFTKIGRDRTYEILANALLDPRVGATLMKRSTTKNSYELLDVLTPYLTTREAGKFLGNQPSKFEESTRSYNRRK